VVVLPSITENAQALARTKGISYYEHRQLYHIALLRDPTIKRVVFLSSIPVGAHSSLCCIRHCILVMDGSG
jgi:hypothetical protein